MKYINILYCKTKLKKERVFKMSLNIDFKTVVKQGLNYNRYYIQSLIKYNKPIIVVGKFVGQANSAETKYTFVDIKPYVPDDYYSYQLTQHINVYKSDFEECYGRKIDPYKGEEFVIVCKPYYYNDDNNIKRASLDPTNELNSFGFPSFTLIYDAKPANEIPWDQVIDFRKEFNYKFACPKNSKYSRYDKEGNPIKDFIYIESINLDNNENINKTTTNLDDMIRNALGCSIHSNEYLAYDSKNTNSKKNKSYNFYKKSNIKSSMKSTAKRRMNDLKHNYQDQLVNNYSLFLN